MFRRFFSPFKASDKSHSAASHKLDISFNRDDRKSEALIRLLIFWEMDRSSDVYILTESNSLAVRFGRTTLQS